MEVTEETIEALHRTFQRRAESSVCEELSRRFSLSAEDALSAYYSSEICHLYNQGAENVLYLSPVLIADQIMEAKTFHTPNE